MTQVDQLNSGFAPKLGIQTQYLDGEGYLVGHSLAGTVVLDPKLKPLGNIVLPISKFVVDRLPLTERSTKVLLHDVSMLKNLPGRLPVFGRKAKQDVSLTYASADAFVASGLAHGFLERLLAAFWTAKNLASVDSAAGLPLSGKHCPAVFAGNGVAGIRVGPPASVGAWHRAIQGVFAPLFPVFPNVGDLHGEGLTAAFTWKLHGRLSALRSACADKVGLVALQITKPLFLFAFPGDNKSVTAHLTNLLQHIVAPFVARQNRFNLAWFAGEVNIGV